MTEATTGTTNTIPRCQRCGKEDRTDEYCADCRKHFKALAEKLVGSLEGYCHDFQSKTEHVFDDFLMESDGLRIVRKIEVRPIATTSRDEHPYAYYRTDGWGNLDEVSRWDAVDWVAFYMEKSGA